MVYLILRLLVAALVALTGVTTEDVTLDTGEVVTDTCSPSEGTECSTDETSTTTPSELPGPSD